MSVKLYPDSVFEDPPTEFGDDIVEACERIRKATKGWGTNEKELIDAIGDENSVVRAQVYYCYKEKYGQDLVKLMKSELSGDFGLALQLLSLPIDQAEARMIHESCKGWGTNEKTLYPILCGRTNEEIIQLKKSYFTMYEKDLSVVLSGELSGNFEKFILSCIQGIEEEYDPNNVHHDDKAKEDAQAFYDAGAGTWGTDEGPIINVLVKSPPEHLKNVNQFYTDKRQITLIKSIGDEMSGDLAKAAIFTIGMKLRPYITVAQYIKETMEGFGTDELALTFALIRYERILADVNVAYIEEYGTTIVDDLEGEIGGNYKKLLVKFVQDSING